MKDLIDYISEFPGVQSRPLSSWDQREALRPLDGLSWHQEEEWMHLCMLE